MSVRTQITILFVSHPVTIKARLQTIFDMGKKEGKSEERTKKYRKGKDDEGVRNERRRKQGTIVRRTGNSKPARHRTRLTQGNG